MMTAAHQPVRVLIVEDEAIIAMTAEDMIVDIGHVVAGVAGTVTSALAAVDAGGFDLAMLDINLNGEQSIAVAVRLHERGIPFIFTTGYGSPGPDPRFPHATMLPKPYRLADLATAITRALG